MRLFLRRAAEFMTSDMTAAVLCTVAALSLFTVAVCAVAGRL